MGRIIFEVNHDAESIYAEKISLRLPLLCFTVILRERFFFR